MNRRWNKTALELHSKGHGIAEIVEMLSPSYPEVTYAAVKSFLYRIKEKGGGRISPQLIERACNAIEKDEWLKIAQDLRLRGKTYREIQTFLETKDVYVSTDVIRKSLASTVSVGPIGSGVAKASGVEEKSNNDFTYSATTEYSNGETTFTRVIELQKGVAITPKTVLEAHGLKPEEWEVVTHKTGFWQAQQGEGVTTELYQSKITVKPKKNPMPSFEEIAEHMSTFVPKCKPTLNYTPVSPKADTMIEINIADLHLGKLAKDAESGDTYNFNIARRRFNDIIDQEIARMQLYPVEEILFVWSNDFFNSDGMGATTTAGTPQDNDLSWREMFMVGCEMLVTAITKLSIVAPVKTFLIASNHSQQVEFYTINYLAAWFKDDPRVTIDINCRTRWYYRYGTNLIGFSHSSYEKKQNLPVLMQLECPEDWGQTTYREFHLAHYHCEQTKEQGGIIFRWLPSLTGSDAWHDSCGYRGAVQRSYSFVWNKHVGLVGINVDYPRDRLIKGKR